MSDTMEVPTTGPAGGPDVEPSSIFPAPQQGSGAGVIDVKHEGHRRYTIIDKDDAEIIRTAGELLDGSRLKDNHDLRVANLTSVFKRIAVWAEAHRGSLVAAYLTAQSRRVTLFFVSSSERYDIKLDADMTDLEVQLGGSAGVGTVESFQIPEHSLDQFVGGDAVLLWKR